MYNFLRKKRVQSVLTQYIQLHSGSLPRYNIGCPVHINNTVVSPASVISLDLREHQGTILSKTDVLEVIRKYFH